jgi:hypothetical protein
VVEQDFPQGLRQPDRRSCGAACLVVAHALRHPAYAEQVDSPDGFRAEVLAMHRRVTSVADVSGRAQLPWPQALGTPPWAVARQLEGSTGVPHRTDLVRGADRVATYAALVGGGLPAALYVGQAWLPRHVALVLGADAHALRVYEPAGGRVERVTREAFLDGRLDLGGWDVPWFLVGPVAPPVTRP